MAVNSVAILCQSAILDSHALPIAPIDQSVLGFGLIVNPLVLAKAAGVISVAAWHSSLAIAFATRNRSVALAAVGALNAWLLASIADRYVVCLTLSTVAASTVVDAFPLG